MDRTWIGRGGIQLELLNRMGTETAGMPAIDMHSISELAESDEMGDQFVVEIIGVFLADLSERVRAIGLQMNDGDRAGVAANAHAIKGSCGHFGAARLVELAHDLEKRARHEPTSDLQSALDSMIEETERVRAALEAFRRNQMPPT